jgi:predicted enzyme related to lactoylglutathione lyase
VKRIHLAAINACAVLMMAGNANAEVTLNSVRVGARDTEALAKFYESAFGMQEVNRIAVPGGPEIFVNFGASVEAAKANRTPPVVLMHRDSDAANDPIAHVIFNVTDMTVTVAAIQSCRRHDAGRSAAVQGHRHRPSASRSIPRATGSSSFSRGQ